MVEAIIFDLFGTLVDSFSTREYEGVVADMAAILGAVPDDFVPLWLKMYNERSTGFFPSTEACIQHVCQALGLRPEQRRISAAAQARFELTRRNLVPRADAVETLSRLKVLGYKIGLISDCAEEVPSIWSDTPLAPLVNVTVFSCTVGIKKPDPRIYRLACDQLGVAPRKCLYVGDGGSFELTGAKRVGMQAVRIRIPGEDDLDAHRVDAEEWSGPEIASLKEVLALVE